MSRSVLNFVNFIRGCEPRRPKDLLLPVKEEIAADRKAGIKHTFLFQYDALLREDLVTAVRGRDGREHGTWVVVRNRPSADGKRRDPMARQTGL